VKTHRTRLEEEQVVAIDRFVSAQDCGLMLDELNHTLWRPSAVVNKNAAGALVNRNSEVRVSESAQEDWFSAELLACLRKQERRLARWLGEGVENFEPWQATRYAKGGHFDLHLDVGYWSDEPAGERRTTVLLFLDTPSRGGGTSFPRLDLDFKAQAGRVLIWNNLLSNGEADRSKLHSGKPLLRGSKTTLVSWIRQRPVRSPAKKSRNSSYDFGARGRADSARVVPSPASPLAE
jgi:prolyl 4-hydroxylase